MSAVRAPFRSSKVLVATVEPCIMFIGISPFNPHCFLILDSPCKTTLAGLSGVERSLNVSKVPFAGWKITKSVNVPPISMPMRKAVSKDGFKDRQEMRRQDCNSYYDSGSIEQA